MGQWLLVFPALDARLCLNGRRTDRRCWVDKKIGFSSLKFFDRDGPPSKNPGKRQGQSRAGAAPKLWGHDAVPAEQIFCILSAGAATFEL